MPNGGLWGREVLRSGNGRGGEGLEGVSVATLGLERREGFEMRRRVKFPLLTLRNAVTPLGHTHTARNGGSVGCCTGG